MPSTEAARSISLGDAHSNGTIAQTNGAASLYQSAPGQNGAAHEPAGAGSPAGSPVPLGELWPRELPEAVETALRKHLAGLIISGPDEPIAFSADAAEALQQSYTNADLKRLGITRTENTQTTTLEWLKVNERPVSILEVAVFWARSLDYLNTTRHHYLTLKLVSKIPIDSERADEHVNRYGVLELATEMRANLNRMCTIIEEKLIPQVEARRFGAELSLHASADKAAATTLTIDEARNAGIAVDGKIVSTFFRWLALNVKEPLSTKFVDEGVRINLGEFDRFLNASRETGMNLAAGLKTGRILAKQLETNLLPYSHHRLNGPHSFTMAGVLREIEESSRAIGALIGREVVRPASENAPVEPEPAPLPTARTPRQRSAPASDSRPAPALEIRESSAVTAAFHLIQRSLSAAELAGACGFQMTPTFETRFAQWLGSYGFEVPRDAERGALYPFELLKLYLADCEAALDAHVPNRVRSIGHREVVRLGLPEPIDQHQIYSIENLRNALVDYRTALNIYQQGDYLITEVAPGSPGYSAELYFRSTLALTHQFTGELRRWLELHGIGGGDETYFDPPTIRIATVRAYLEYNHYCLTHGAFGSQLYVANADLQRFAVAVPPGEELKRKHSVQFMAGLTETLLGKVEKAIADENLKYF